MTETFYRLLQSLPRPLDQKALILPALRANAVTIGFGGLAKELTLSNLKFQDLRHDVASKLTMAGVPQRTVMEILGHKDQRMTLRDQHLSPDHLRRSLHALEQPAPSEPSKEILGIK